MTEEQINERDTLVKTSVSLPLYLYEWVQDISRKKSTKKRKFNSQSAVIITALAELKGRMELREELAAKESTQRDFEMLVDTYFETEAGQAHLKKLTSKKYDNTQDNGFKRRVFME